MNLPGLALTALAYIVGALVFCLVSGKRGFERRQTTWILLAALGGGILGAKLSRLCIAVLEGADPLQLLAHPDGRTIIGGVIGGWLAVELAKKGCISPNRPEMVLPLLFQPVKR